MSESEGFLEGQLLLAMPGMPDPRFDRTVIYICSWSEDGVMGLVINRHMRSLTFGELLEQLDIEVEGEVTDLPIHAGGPVETGRGFVLHSVDYLQESSLTVSETMALTATVDILKAIAEGEGPQRRILALGYAGWTPGQLERELHTNSWLTCPADEELIFATEPEDMWPRAMAMMGIDVAMLSSLSGHA